MLKGRPVWGQYRMLIWPPILRARRCRPEVGVPSLADVLIQRSRQVRFTVDRTEVVALLAATIREQRLKDILEGLRLAGLLNEPSKNRRAGIAVADRRFP